MGGPVVSRVTVKDGKVTNVEVLEHAETPGIGVPVIENMPGKFSGVSSAAEVDAVDGTTGATITSNALKETVKKALELVK